MNAHDRRTRGHSERVRAFNDLLAEEMELSPRDRDLLRWAALLHDIGKLHVPTRILNKPGRLTDAEWVTLHKHPAEGARIAAPLQEWLVEWAGAIGEHHERWDGSGYPNGLKGEEISLGARIVAVADAYEVITAPRPYKRPIKAEAARQELTRCAGTDFDPAVVRAFLNISIGRIRLVMGPLSWLAQLPFLGALPQLEGTAVVAGRQAATLAGTATGVGVMAMSGIIHPAAAQSSTLPTVAMVERAANLSAAPVDEPTPTTVVRSAPPVRTYAAAGPVAVAPHPPTTVVGEPDETEPPAPTTTAAPPSPAPAPARPVDAAPTQHAAPAPPVSPPTTVTTAPTPKPAPTTTTSTTTPPPATVDTAPADDKGHDDKGVRNHGDGDHGGGSATSSGSGNGNGGGGGRGRDH